MSLYLHACTVHLEIILKYIYENAIPQEVSVAQVARSVGSELL
jgi:hypothetical protein